LNSDKSKAGVCSKPTVLSLSAATNRSEQFLNIVFRAILHIRDLNMLTEYKWDWWIRMCSCLRLTTKRTTRL